MGPLQLLDPTPLGPHIWVSESKNNSKEMPLIVFDRDNTLIADAGQHNRIENLEFLPGALDSLRLCFEFGYAVGIATNQAGISKGLFDIDTLNLFHQELNSQIISSTGSSINVIAACPHQLGDNCNCRKPKPGLLEILALGRSDKVKVFFGDSVSDVKAAQTAGICGILIEENSLFDQIEKWILTHDYC